MKQYNKLCLLILATFFLAFCKQKVEIKVVSDNSLLGSVIEDFSLANYGFVPYGQTIYSRVRLASPLTGCSSLESSEDDQYAQILLMERGDCTFLQKTKQAELSGAKLLLVVDSKEEAEKDIVIVADHSSVTHIPTIMLEKTIGDSMIHLLQEGEDIVLSVIFPKPDQSNKAFVDFWLDSFDKQSYEFLAFATLNSSLSKILSTDAVIFTPHYVIWYCFQCEANDYKDDAWEEVDEYCLSKGRYCNPDPDRSDFYDGPMKGRDVVEEDWRQICIYEIYRSEVESNFDQSTWIKYMLQFYNECILTVHQNLKQCGDGVMESLGIKKNLIDKCFTNNIEQKNTPNTIISNLELQKSKFIEEEIMVWPTLFINNLSFQGDLQSNSTIETICLAVEQLQQPIECIQYLQNGEIKVIHKGNNSIACFSLINQQQFEKQGKLQFQ